MAHVLKITDGTTTVTLTSASTGYLLPNGYVPRTPDITLQEAYSVILDGGDVLNATHRNVTESASVHVVGANGAAVQSRVNSIERLLEQATRRQENKRAAAVYVQIQMDSDSAEWRSEILSGRVDLADNVWTEWSNNKAEVVISWTRRFFWEAASETEVPIDSVVDAKQTGGVEITNHRDGSVDGNIVDILAADVLGVLPAACRLIIRNIAGASVGYNNIYIGQFYDGTPASFTHYLEGEDNETGGGEITGAGNGSGTHNGGGNASILTDTTQAWTTNEWANHPILNVTDGSRGTIQENTATTVTPFTLTGGTDNDFDTGDEYVIGDEDLYSDGFYYAREWASSVAHTSTLYLYTISGTQLGYANGGYFRLLVRFAEAPTASTYVKVRLYHQTSLKLYETPEVKLTTDLLQDLGVIQLPPSGGGLSTLGAITMHITARSSVAGSLDIDFIHMFPLDGWRHIKTLGGSFADASEIVDDGMADLMYTDVAGTAVYANLVGYGRRIHLIPDKRQFLYILFDEGNNMHVNRESEVQIYYRPRRLTV